MPYYETMIHQGVLADGYRFMIKANTLRDAEQKACAECWRMRRLSDGRLGDCSYSDLQDVIPEHPVIEDRLGNLLLPGSRVYGEVSGFDLRPFHGVAMVDREWIPHIGSFRRLQLVSTKQDRPTNVKVSWEGPGGYGRLFWCNSKDVTQCGLLILPLDKDALSNEHRVAAKAIRQAQRDNKEKTNE